MSDTVMARSILVVDDSEIILATAEHALTAAGYRVVTANTFAELSSRLDIQREYDLILMDVQMPELYGDDVGAILRYTREVQGKIYLFSSMPAAQLEQRQLEAGLDGYIPKQVGMDAMVARVREILGA